jgi:molybdopterin converting factor subunit 1
MQPSDAITVHFFAAAAERMMCRSLEAPCPVGFTVSDLRSLLTSSSPSLADLLPRCAVAVNHEYADDDQPLHPGDEVAIIPPVSGG